jgi:hypothetical protein
MENQKEFVTIRNLVNDIENYDKFSEFEVRNNSIDSLIKYLEKYKLLERKSITFFDLENKDKFQEREKENSEEYSINHYEVCEPQMPKDRIEKYK